ncbi:MAG: Etoposide-induced EI24 protein [Candidatus Tokpelaia hoelldobleri]|uniref:Etoposide-induced EI24 protein n=1 Tax=Candidatus Tokpelaia hoelldobleri TaxID=1902579 RepID=A0A1U9JWW1_9HYPH|nr:MAG: Etoposide-induced EI24 protein [Candidatus Tokpelaia hoelldoblerii]
MLFDSILLALKRLVTPQFRSMLWKSLGLTVLMLVLAWLGLRTLFYTTLAPWLATFFPDMPAWFHWFGVVGTFLFALVFGIGLATALAFLIAPLTALVGSFFIDEAADIIEKKNYRTDKPGKAMPLGRALLIAFRFLGLSLLGNAFVLLCLLFAPGLHMIAFLVINGYLLGREYFEFAAVRLRPEKQAKQFYQKNALTVFLGGLAIAVFLSIPLLNLLTPLFAAALMVHLHKKLSHAKA